MALVTPVAVLVTDLIAGRIKKGGFY